MPHGFLDEFLLQDELLTGGGYVVKKGLRISDAEPKEPLVVCIFTEGMTEVEKKSVQEDIATFKQLHHPSLLALDDTYTEERWTYLVYQSVQGGSLENHLKDGRTLTEVQTRAVVRSVLEVLVYLNTNHYAHGRVSAGTIFFPTTFGAAAPATLENEDRDWYEEAKLASFDRLPTMEGEDEAQLGDAATVFDLEDMDELGNVARDVICLGLLATRCLRGLDVLGEDDGESWTVLEDKVSARVPPAMSHFGQEALTLMLGSDVTQGIPSPAKLLQHPWFEGSIAVPAGEGSEAGNASGVRVTMVTSMDQPPAPPVKGAAAATAPHMPPPPSSRSGWLLKQGSRKLGAKWKKKWCVLEEGSRELRMETSPGSDKAKVLPLREAKVDAVLGGGKPHCFQLQYKGDGLANGSGPASGKTVVIACETAASLGSWVKVLQAECDGPLAEDAADARQREVTNDGLALPGGIGYGSGAAAWWDETLMHAESFAVRSVAGAGLGDEAQYRFTAEALLAHRRAGSFSSNGSVVSRIPSMASMSLQVPVTIDEEGGHSRGQADGQEEENGPYFASSISSVRSFAAPRRRFSSARSCRSASVFGYERDRAMAQQPSIFKNSALHWEKRAQELKDVMATGRPVGSKAKFGDRWFILDARWMDSWLSFCTSACRRSPPGPIDNSWMLISDQRYTPYSDLKEGTRETMNDYKRVAPAMWQLLIKIYGGGPAIYVDGTPHDDVTRWTVSYGYERIESSSSQRWNRLSVRLPNPGISKKALLAACKESDFSSDDEASD
ncbi:unnamed protein product [Chrysoparadoxa australica]